MAVITLTQKLQLNRAGVQLSSKATERAAVKEMKKISKFTGKTAWSSKF